MGWIYIFTFPNSKQYVGQTKDLKDRYRGHRNGKDQKVDKAIQKYGWKNVQKIAMKCSNEYLDWIEEEWVKELDSFSKGYNSTKDGKGDFEKNWFNNHSDKEKIRKDRSERMKDNKLGALVKKEKIVYQYSLDGQLIKKWNSFKEATKELSILSSGISNALTNKNKSYKNYQWFYEPCEKKYEIEPRW